MWSKVDGCRGIREILWWPLVHFETWYLFCFRFWKHFENLGILSFICGLLDQSAENTKVGIFKKKVSKVMWTAQIALMLHNALQIWMWALDTTVNVKLRGDMLTGG